jgi:hypothetical protein
MIKLVELSTFLSKDLSNFVLQHLWINKIVKVRIPIRFRNDDSELTNEFNPKEKIDPISKRDMENVCQFHVFDPYTLE